MKVKEIASEKDRVVSLFDLLMKESPKVDLKAASAFGQFMAVQSGGFVERTVQLTMYDYAKTRSNAQISSFVLKRAKFLNSLNCEKIERFLEPFDKSWWQKIETLCGQDVLQSIDSLKSIRDDVAHGKHNGTGINIVKNYFDHAVVFSREFQEVILE